MGIVRCVRSMTRAVGVLGGVDEPENGSTRRGHGESMEKRRNYVFLENSDNTTDDSWMIAVYYLMMECNAGRAS